jgi:hypothetical protein
MHQQNISRGVNILQLNSAQMRQMSVGLKDLFENELNSMLERMMPDDDWSGWSGFEWAYEESVHRIREHITRQLDEVQDVYTARNE